MDAMRVIAKANLDISEAGRVLADLAKPVVDLPVVPQADSFTDEKVAEKPVKNHDAEIIEIKLSKELAEVTKILADAYLEAGNAKIALANIKALEKDYISDREKKAIQKIQENLDNSRDLIQNISDNHKKVKDFSSTLTEFATLLDQIYAELNVTLQDFHKKDELWNKDIQEQQEEIEKQKQEIKIERIRINNDNESIKKAREVIKNEQIKLRDRQAMIRRTMDRLKIKRI